MQSLVPFYSKIPFLRLLIPLITGILIQWYNQFSISTIYCTGAIVLFFFILTQFFSIKIIFRYGWITGIIINCMLVCLGALLTYQKNIRNDKRFFSKFYNSSSTIEATILESPVEKENSIKATAEANIVVRSKSVFRTTGTIIIYFKKDSSASRIHFGSTIIFNKTLQEIKNTGNPGAFDYRQYCLFNGITHQVYLPSNDYVVCHGEVFEESLGMKLTRLLTAAREKTITVLRKFITSKKELGLAEALLINYKDDLDKGLIQSYTNTGVVHIIAISGQHLALIYWLLLQILAPLKRTSALRLLTTFIIICILWLFSLMTGAQPSIIRAALMCTIMLLAEVFSRRSNTLNSLACSAFILLCFNPFDLWDVGFQLSYAGLLSLVLFTRSIYNLIYVGNKSLQYIWKLVAASIAAQILTTPISIYHFHQFPFSFLLTNLLAVPLSSLVLTLELSLFIFSFITPLAVLTGKLLTIFIWLMNTWVERIEGLHGLLWDGLQITIVQTVFLYISIAGLTLWLVDEVKNAIWIGMAGLIFFLSIRSYSFKQSMRQEQLVVYNIPKHNAIDLIDGRKFYFIGDRELSQDGFLKNFNIKPARTLFRVQSLQHIGGDENISFNCCGKRVVIANGANAIDDSVIDVLIVLKPLNVSFNSSTVKKVVIGSSFPQWKVEQLKKELNELHIPVYDVSIDGAFILNLKHERK